jgi:nitroreductase
MSRLGQAQDPAGLRASDRLTRDETSERGRGLHPLLRARFSPLSFDPDSVVDEAHVKLLLEAARWAPSAGNSQPWAFYTAIRDSPEHAILSRHLAPSSARWAPSASLLVVNIVHLHVETSDIEFSEFADYDLGQAVAHMTLEAEALGLACRQFRAFDLEPLSTQLNLAAGWRIRSMTAIGRARGVAPPRDRRPVADLRQAALSDTCLA